MNARRNSLQPAVAQILHPFDHRIIAGLLLAIRAVRHDLKIVDAMRAALRQRHDVIDGHLQAACLYIDCGAIARRTAVAQRITNPRPFRCADCRAVALAPHPATSALCRRLRAYFRTCDAVTIASRALCNVPVLARLASEIPFAARSLCCLSGYSIHSCILLKKCKFCKIIFWASAREIGTLFGTGWYQFAIWGYRGPLHNTQ